MTPDGISDEDWTKVRDAAVEVVNANDTSEEARSYDQMLRVLDQLEAKYGTLPSILATRADYVGDPLQSAALLERAYELAVERDDRLNRLEIADSLAQVWIEDLVDVDAGTRWLAVFAEELRGQGDQSLIEAFQRLEERLHTLAKGRPASGNEP
jgi:hypothetical protein